MPLAAWRIRLSGKPDFLIAAHAVIFNRAGFNRAGFNRRSKLNADMTSSISPVECFILTAEPRTTGGQSAMVLCAASSLGPLEIVADFKPYFFVRADADITSAVRFSALPAAVEEEFTALDGRRVRKLEFPNIGAAYDARRSFENAGTATYEADVRARERFLMDRRINGGVIATGAVDSSGGKIRMFNPRLTPAKVSVSFKVLSLDIETSMRERNIFSIGLHLTGRSIDQRMVFMIGDAESPGAGSLVYVPDERVLLKSFVEWINDNDPDIIIGWNVIGFDLSYLAERALALGVPLTIGRGKRPFKVAEKSSRWQRSDLYGRIVLDGPQLLRTSFYSFESYSLENVSQQVLGEGKLIHSDRRGWEIERLFERDKPALADYNLKDCVLVSRIFDKLGLIELTRRRSELSGMLLDQVGMSTASFDHFYLPRLHDQGFAAPDVSAIGEVTPAAGGYVMEPVAGIYEDVLGFDFQSLYPSIIRSFKIDPLSRACAGEDTIRTPGGIPFSNSRSILPAFIGELIEERRRARKAGDKALTQAIKILMNSFYGVMGSSGSRLYHPSLPDAITSTGQWLLIQSRNWLEQNGHRVIYGDTDSMFVQLAPDYGSPAERGAKLAAELTAYWKSRLNSEFGVESFLLLEFKKHYRKFLVPPARAGSGGAKKRYAGLVVLDRTEEVEFVGLEAVRSDWTRLARDFQIELYGKIFRNEPVDQWIRNFVAGVRRGEHDDKLIYKKRLHKPVGEYGASPPPYVRAAMMLPRAGRTIRYIMTINGPVPVELDPKSPDYAHYIERQLRPVADSILELLDTSFDEILSPQLKLF